jgi:hypothetical protein
MRSECNKFNCLDLCKHFHVGPAVGTLVVLLLLPLSLAMNDGGLTMVDAVAGEAAQQQQQWRRWWQWTRIGGKSGRQQEQRWSHDGVR